MIDTNLRRSVRPAKNTLSRTPSRIARAAGRAWTGLEQVEPRILLAGDHPSLPVPWGPNPPADTVTLNSTLGNERGRGQATGTIHAGDSGDLFKFVAPANRRIVGVVSIGPPAAGVVTAVTNGAHMFQTGDQITIAGATPAGFNGTFTITVTDATHFTYANATAGTATGAITATGLSHAAKDFITLLADTTSVNANDGGADGNSGTLPNTGRLLDTFVEVYDSNGNLIATGADNGSGTGLAGAITIGLNSLLPPAQRAPDGWVGFEGTVGATYYVRVRADPTPITGRDNVGRYALRIGGAATELNPDLSPDQMIGGVTVPNVDFGSTFLQGTLGTTSGAGWLGNLQQDLIYEITTPSDQRFNSVATFQAISDDNTLLNPHVDVFSSGNTQGVVQRLTSDTDAGRQTDSYTTYLGSSNTAYYVRIRSDDLRTMAGGGQPAGVFQMLNRFAANNVAIDPEMRLGQTGAAITSIDDPLDPWTNVPLRTHSTNPNARAGTESQIFRFTAQGTGLGIVTVVSQATARGLTMLPPLPQPAIHLYDENGNSVDFNKGTNSAQLFFSVVGNHSYYIVVEGFDNAADGGFKMFIEAHHTLDITQPVDDHLNTPVDGNGNIVPSIPTWQLATPLLFGDPFQPLDNEGNPSRDRTWLQTAVGRGRILGAGDTDVFQFTAPVNELSTYAGDDGNQTSPLYVGGNFAQAGLDPRTGLPYDSNNVGIFDAGSWFNAGAPTEDTGAMNGPIFAMAVWDVDGAGAAPAELAVGGQFNMVNGNPAGNLAFRVFDAANGRYVWSANPTNLTSMNPITTNGPVFALGSGDVIPATNPLQLNVTAPELYVGGQFTQFNGGAANNIAALFLNAGGLATSNLNGGVTGAGAAVRAITLWTPPTPASFPMKPVVGMDTVTTPPNNPPTLPLQVYFGGTFSNGFATNPAIAAPRNDAVAPGPNLTNLGNLAHWGVRNVMGDVLPTLQGGGLPNGYNISWGATMPAVVPGIAIATSYGVNGPVNALTVWDDPGQQTINGTTADIPERLIIGGQFTSTGTRTVSGDVQAPATVNATNIISYDVTQAGNGTVPNAGAPAAPMYENIGNLTAAQVVRALSTWHAATTTGGVVGNEMNQTLLAAGDETAGGELGILQSLNSSGTIGTGWAPLITADDGTIRTITTFKNDAIAFAPGTDANGALNDFETIYIGGDFTMLGGGNFGANHVSRLEIRLNIPAIVWGGLDNGTTGIAPDQPGGTPSKVFALSTFNDNITGVWDRNERAATRVSITLNATLDSRLSPQSQIRVFDSNFNIIYSSPTQGGALNLDPTNQAHVPGANDPSLTPAFPNPNIAPWVQPGAPFPGVQVWAGEVYYIEVSDPAGGTGRYTLTVNTDAIPPRPDPATEDMLGDFPDGISDYTTPVGKGQFATAPEIQLDGNGRGRPFRDPLAPLPNTAAYSARIFGPTPANITRVETFDPPVISRVTDTQIYQFRAQNDGTAEIRLSTLGIVRTYQEQFIDNDGNVTSNPQSKTINSPFHGAIRIYNNDFVQVAYSNGNQGVQGFAQTVPTLDANANANPPEAGTRTYTHDDPRLVINIQRGKTYFIEVESAYKGSFALNPDLVDWRFATGAYDLSINATPSLGGVDDYWPNFDFGGGTPVDGVNGSAIPIDRQTGAGTISGIIQNIIGGPFANPNDTDTFSIISQGRGQSTITVTPTSSLLSPRVRIYVEAISQGVFTYQLVTTASGGIGGVATAQFPSSQGQRFFVVVDGAGTQGGYIVNVTSPVQADDQPFSNATPNDITDPIAGWANPTTLQLNRFLGLYGAPVGGTGSIAALQGNIENPADRDTYKFTAEAYEIATVHVNHLDATLNPLVLVYEINRDGAGREVFLRIGINDDTSGANNDSTATFSTTPGRDYYVIVLGSNLNTDYGRYTLAVNVAATDDHPNIEDFNNGSIINLALDPINFTADGSDTGVIERNTDTDLFRFTAAASGTGTITLARAVGSTLALDLVVLSSNNTPLPGVTFTTTANSIVAHVPTIAQGQQYYLLVRPNAVVPVGSTDTGAYTLAVHTDPIDDYLPTPGTSSPTPTDFAGAQNIPINSVNGIGTLSATLVPLGDSDLFTFTTLAAGPTTVRISTPSSLLNPRVVIYDSSHTQVFASGGNGDSAAVTFNASGIAQYYILVLADSAASGSTAVGSYTVTATSALPGGGGGGGPDDFPNAGEWNDAANIGLDARTGAGAISGVISPASDTDLFKFSVPGDGFVDIQLNTPTGGLVDGQLKVFNSAHTLVFQDSAGILGATASLHFAASAGEQYFVLVEPVGAVTGSYTLRVAAQPTTHYLYFPEGFAGSTINEYVPIVNPNSVAVDFQVYARYETGANDNVPIYTGTVPANSRGGITISTAADQAHSLVRIGVPYSLEIRSTGPLGATFSHYDFNSSVGESFTDRLSTTWTFAEANKDHNNFRDFLLFYNPGSVTANITVTLYYQNGTTASFVATVDGLRRGGVNFDADSRIATSGKFGVKVTSDQPIVSSITSYNLPRSGGDGLLGDANSGNTQGVVTNVSSGAGVTSSVSILNTGDQSAVVTLVADYGRTDIPKLVRVFTIPAHSQFNRLLSAVGLIAGQTAGITYSSNIAVTFQVTEYKLGDGDTSTTATEAAREYFFGDLFVNPALAGIKYIEQLGLYNPSGVGIDVTATFLYADGSPSATAIYHVGAGTFTFVSIDQQPAIIGRPAPTAFSLVLSSSTPFVAGITHYDLFLNGGWSAIGAPIGLTNPLTTLV